MTLTVELGTVLYCAFMIITSSISGFVWVRHLTGQEGIFVWLPILFRKVKVLPPWLHKGWFECEICNSLWWLLGYSVLVIYFTRGAVVLMMAMWTLFVTMLIIKFFERVRRR